MSAGLRHSRMRRLGHLLFLLSFAGCATLLGADFDHPSASAAGDAGDAGGAIDAFVEGDAGSSDASDSGETSACDAAPDCVTPLEYVVLFGGHDDHGRLTDTWIWDSHTWTKSPAAPPADLVGDGGQVDFAMTTLGGKAVLLGGPHMHLWQWSGSSWDLLPVDGAWLPPLGGVSSLASFLTSLVLFSETPATQDAGATKATFTWDGTASAWDLVYPYDGGPSWRTGQAMASRGSTLLLQGGEDQSGNFPGDTWQWDGAQWVRVSTNGPQLFDHSMAPLGGGFIIWGGTTTYQWDAGAWTDTGAAGPPPRGGSAMASLRGQVVLFGGWGYPQGQFGDTWVWDGTEWTYRDVPGPSARSGHAMATFTR